MHAVHFASSNKALDAQPASISHPSRSSMHWLGWRQADKRRMRIGQLGISKECVSFLKYEFSYIFSDASEATSNRRVAF